MNPPEKSEAGERAVVNNRTMEIVVAGLFLLFGLVFAWSSYDLGAGWSDDGPQSGYFPFYINIIIVIASAATLAQALRGKTHAPGAAFVTRGQLRQVLAVLIPATVYVLGVQLFGIYLASAVYIAVFMIWLGKYPWIKAVALGVTISVAVYFMFEVWFKVSLHKGSWFDPLSLIGL
jgi:putative tricarboxylic transport membrane protein